MTYLNEAQEEIVRSVKQFEILEIVIFCSEIEITTKKFP